jgi:hypothetical protein
VSVVSDRCAHLEHLNLRNSQACGRFLKEYLISNNQSVRYLDLRSCPRIESKWLLEFLENYHLLTHFYIGDHGVNLIEPLLKNHLKLTCLHITLNPVSFRFLDGNVDGLIARLEFLTELGIEHSWCSYGPLFDKTVTRILNVCTRLKIFNVNFCGQVSDAAFTTLPVKAPLVELHAYKTNLTRLTFNCLVEKSQLKSSLRTLNISECRHLNKEDIFWLVGTFEKLTKIEISFSNLFRIKRWLDHIQSYPERFFNLYGFVDIPGGFCEYFKEKQTILRVVSVAYMNFRIHFKSLVDEIANRR